MLVLLIEDDPELSDGIATFLAEGASESQVRRVLLASRAESPEITSVIHPDAATKAASPEQNLLMKAVKKLTGKD